MPDEELEVEESEVQLEIGASVCSVGLGPADLKYMVNGFSGDELRLRPFDRCMTHNNIRKKWIAVKFLPVRRDFDHKKVQYEMVLGVRRRTQLGG